MLQFITLITALCSQPGIGHGSDLGLDYARKFSQLIREDTYDAQKACTKRLFAACTEKHLLSKQLITKDASCLVENL